MSEWSSLRTKELLNVSPALKTVIDSLLEELNCIVPEIPLATTYPIV